MNKSISTTQFKENHPRLKGFNAYYQEHIHPQLADMEARRKKAVKVGAMIFAPFGSLAGFFAYLGLTFVGNSDDNIFMELAFGSVALGWFLAFMKARSVKAGFDAHVAGAIAKFLDLTYHKVNRFNPLSRFRELSLVPSYDRSSLEDEVSGSFGDATLRLVEAHLKEKRTSGSGNSRKTRYVTVFRGLLVEMSFPKNFEKRTVITRDGFGSSLFGSWGMPGERVKLEDPVFEDLFEVYSEDQVEARYLLTPTFMDRLVKLKPYFGSELRLAFVGDKLLMAGPRSDDMFEAGSIFSNLTDPAHIREVLEEFELIFDVVETLDLDRKTKI